MNERKELKELSLPPNTKILFRVASLFARKLEGPWLARGSSRHRMRVIKARNGWIIIEKAWRVK